MLNARKSFVDEIENNIDNLTKSQFNMRNTEMKYNFFIDIAFDSNKSLEEQFEFTKRLSDENDEWRDFIKQKKEDIEYLKHYIYLNKVFGDGAVWIGTESGRNFDPNNPPRNKLGI